MQHLPKDTQIKRTVLMFCSERAGPEMKSGLQREQTSSRCWNLGRIDRGLMRVTVMGGWSDAWNIYEHRMTRPYILASNHNVDILYPLTHSEISSHDA